MTARFSGPNAYEHLDALARRIGPRHGGSPAEKRAADYLARQFRKIGLKPRLLSYPIYSFDDADARLTRPDGTPIPCAAIPMTGSTPPRGLTRPILFLDEPSPLYLDDRVRNRIVITFGEFQGDAKKRFLALRPAALVSIQTAAHRKHFRGTGKAGEIRRIGSVPSVRLTLEDGQELIRNLPEKLTLHMTTRNARVTRGVNVVADLKGSTEPDDVLMVCAHFDSVWAGPGAMDNGGGAAVLLELARIFAETGAPRTLRFIAFGGEEMGVWGSKAYVRKLKEQHDRLRRNKDFVRDGRQTEFDRIRFLVNLDMMGPRYGQSRAITLGHPDIAAAARLFANEINYPLTVRENAIYSSDNMPFNYAGIPSISFNRTGFGDMGGHTVDDVIDNCSPEGLEHIGAFVERWMTRYLLQPRVLPFPKTFPDAAKKAVSEWFGDQNPLEDDVYGPDKRYRTKRTKRTSRK